ncbi:activity-regulated cytoskeleton associated protein 2-like [Photinus pyralis]|nr:activity-regulated cytoskeleton associated protein 2-like [Photinus pyralis]
MVQPILLTDEQFQALLRQVGAAHPVGNDANGHFAKCNARFDGLSDVEAFLDSISTYKDCLKISDVNALRGLPMLLDGLAATWWQGIKQTTLTWEDAVKAL